MWRHLDLATRCLALVLVGACTIHPPSAGAGDAALPLDAVDGATSTPDGSETYTRLIGRTWTLPPGAERYKCVRATIPVDTFVTSIVAQAPLGTHQAILSLAGAATSGPDGEYDCVFEALGRVMLFSSAIGTAPLEFPRDVGLKIGAGQQIHLNLHVVNASDQPLEGDSAILVKAQPTPPPALAEMVFAGKVGFSIPPSGAPHQINGGCNATDDHNLFAVWPHMNGLAIHQRVELVRGGNTMLLHDALFQHDDQRYHVKSPAVPVQAGDRINVVCTFDKRHGIHRDVRDQLQRRDVFCRALSIPGRRLGPLPMRPVTSPNRWRIDRPRRI